MYELEPSKSLGTKHSVWGSLISIMCELEPYKSLGICKNLRELQLVVFKLCYKV